MCLDKAYNPSNVMLFIFKKQERFGESHGLRYEHTQGLALSPSQWMGDLLS